MYIVLTSVLLITTVSHIFPLTPSLHSFPPLAFLLLPVLFFKELAQKVQKILVALYLDGLPADILQFQNISVCELIVW